MTRLRTCRWSARIARVDTSAFRRAQASAIDIVPLWEKYVAGRGETTWGTGATTTTISPDKRLEALLNALKKLDELGYRRSAQQKLFHKSFIVASLKHIYGREIHRHVGRLMRKFDISELRPDVIVCAIRRAGKTFAVALYIAAFILTQPGVEINVYSTAKRASRKMQALIWKIVVTLAGSPAPVQAYNQEELIVACGNTTSKVNSLPSSVEISFSPYFFLFLCTSVGRVVRVNKKICTLILGVILRRTFKINTTVKLNNSVNYTFSQSPNLCLPTENTTFCRNSLEPQIMSAH